MTQPAPGLPDTAEQGYGAGNSCGRDADGVVTALYEMHYRPLVRLAALLVQDVTTAQDIVQDSFAALYHRWRGHDAGLALCYLRQSVVHRSRSVPRRRMAAGRAAARSAPGAGQQLTAAGQVQPAILSALGSLPARQREAMALRYYADLPEAQIASIMGVSPGAVKSHTARATAAMRAVVGSLEE